MKYLVADATTGQILRTGNAANPMAAWRQAREGEAVYTHVDVGLVDDGQLEVRNGTLARKADAAEPVQGEGTPVLRITLEEYTNS